MGKIQQVGTAIPGIIVAKPDRRPPDAGDTGEKNALNGDFAKPPFTKERHMLKSDFKGVITAVVTPFTAADRPDLPNLQRLVQ